MGVILYEFLTSVAPFNGNSPDELFENVLNGEILWPEPDDELIHIPEDTKCLIMGLLTHDPVKRLGASGAIEIKAHRFFANLDWDNLLMVKTDFIPQLDGPEDTSYFDSRLERYNHEDVLNTSVKSQLPNDDDASSQSLSLLTSDFVSKSKNESLSKDLLVDLFAKNLKLGTPDYMSGNNPGSFF